LAALILALAVLHPQVSLAEANPNKMVMQPVMRPSSKPAQQMTDRQWRCHLPACRGWFALGAGGRTDRRARHRYQHCFAGFPYAE
jgi:hypothetical protein